MNPSKKICNHNKAEEQYICLEESCLQKSDYKLDCLKCLQHAHPHHECLIHSETILQDAQKTQKTFLDLFDENQKFCSTFKQKLELDVNEIKQKYSEWIDMQYKLSLGQIEQYELGIKEQKEMFQQTQLTSDQLKTAIEYSLYNNELYMQENKQIQEILEQNQLEFIQYFKFLYERCFKDYEHKITQNNQLPKVQARKGMTKMKEYELCTEVGCTNKKIKFCLEQSCLQQHSALECPTCQGMRHHPKDMQSHRQYFISANDLWEQQNKRIEELEKFCDQQGENIKKESVELQETIMNFILNNDLKLKKLRQFSQNKKNKIEEKLRKFKSLYKKDEQTVHKELFLQKDVSMIAADIVQCSENFLKISNNFKRQCQREKEHYQQDIKDLEDQWSKGLFQIESEKQDSQDINQVSQYIEKLNAQILGLTQQNKQYQQQIQQLTQDLQNVKDQSEILNTKIKEEMNNIFKGFNQQLQQQLINQNKKQQQQIQQLTQDLQNVKDQSEILNTKTKEEMNNIFKGFNQQLQQQLINQNKEQQQQIYNNLDKSMKQQIESSGKLESGIQQIISSAATDKGVNQTLKKEVDQLNIKLTNCINNEATKIKDLIQNIPLVIQQQKLTLLSYKFKEVLKRKLKGHRKYVQQFQLIYSSERDGLNYNSYQSKVSGKTSLIIVCRSKNPGQYVFGGYQHGQWNFTNKYSPDDTGISFVFSQTHNQIYPIKDQPHAQWLGSGYIVYMGKDLDIRADFINGSSSLGNQYSTEQYQIQDNHLYGGPTPNVIECEVYQIIFQ